MSTAVNSPLQPDVEFILGVMTDAFSATGGFGNANQGIVELHAMPRVSHLEPIPVIWKRGRVLKSTNLIPQIPSPALGFCVAPTS
jgi:hypothetical protein